MALTWKNVDAPNFTSAGSLLGAANDSFANALQILQKNSDRAAAQRRSAYSAESLAGLANISDPAAIGEYMKSLDTSQLSPEALDLMMKQPGILLDRITKQKEIDQLSNNIDWTQSNRQGQLDAAPTLIEAIISAQKDNVDGAYSAISRLGTNPYAAMASLETLRSIPEQNVSGVDASENSRDFRLDNERIGAERFARDIFHRDISPYAISQEDAAIKVEEYIQQNNLNAVEAEALRTQVGSKQDEDFGHVDTSDSVFDGQEISFGLDGEGNNRTLSGSELLDINDIGIRSFITDRENLETSSATAIFNDHLSSLSAVQSNRAKDGQVGEETEVGQGYLSDRDYLKSIGLEDDSWISRNFGRGQSLGRVVSSVITDITNDPSRDYRVNKRDVIAAIASIGSNGEIPSRENIIRFLDSVKDGNAIRAHETEQALLRRGTERLSSLSQKIEEQNRRYLKAKQRQDSAGMAKAQQAANDLLRQQSIYLEKLREDRNNLVGYVPPEVKPSPSSEEPVRENRNSNDYNNTEEVYTDVLGEDHPAVRGLQRASSKAEERRRQRMDPSLQQYISIFGEDHPAVKRLKESYRRRNQ